MNYYNPYFYTIPTNIATTAPRVGLFSRLFGGSGITLGGILNGTQRALNFANQAIPLVKQVRPMIGNAKTMFKVMNEFKTNNSKNSSSNMSSNINNNINNNIGNNIDSNNDNLIKDDNGITFFV